MTEQDRDRRKEAGGGSSSAPDAAGADRLRKIRPVDLSLHSDGIDHWQDEPQPAADEEDGKPGGSAPNKQRGGDRSG